MTQDLKDKAIKIQGKNYVLVSDRVLYFNETYPQGSITTELVSEPTNKQIVIKATITPDVANPNKKFTGYSQAVIGEGYINKTSALENAETSAVGRALAFMGIGVIESIASVDEINKAKNSNPVSKPIPAIQLLKNKAFNAGAKTEPEAIKMIISKTGVEIKTLSEINNDKAKQLIDLWAN